MTSDAQDRVWAEVEPQLHRIAVAKLASEQNCSLAPGDLVNDAVARILDYAGYECERSLQIIAQASHVMRQVLVDHARKKLTEKRRHEQVTLVTAIAEDPPIDLIELDLLMEELGQIDPERVRLVEMRFFGGMTIEEIAEATGSSPATVKRRWTATRAWLYHRLSTRP